MIRLLALLLLVFASGAIAVQTAPEQQGSLLISEIEYVEDAHRILDAPSALKLLREYNNRRLADQLFNLGPSESRYWIRLGLHNDSNEQKDLRLLASVAYRLLLKATLFRDDRDAELILDDSIDHHFDQRSTDFRYLSSTSFMLAAGESADILIEYRTLGSSYLPLSLVSDDEFAEIVHSDSVNGALFYSFSAAAILVLMLFSLAMMDKVSAFYGLLFMLGLLFIASMEGYAFKYLWPDWPAWNSLSPLLLQYAVSAFGLLLSWYVISADTLHNRPRRYMRIAIGALALSCFILMLLSLLLPFLPMAVIASLLLALMFLSQGYVLSTWRSPGQKRNALAMVAGVLPAVFVMVMVLLWFDASILPACVYIYSTRLVYLLVILAIIIAHVSGLRRSHEKSLQDGR
jgi:hypothetical protein